MLVSFSSKAGNLCVSVWTVTRWSMPAAARAERQAEYSTCTSMGRLRPDRAGHQYFHGLSFLMPYGVQTSFLVLTSFLMARFAANDSGVL